MTTTNEKSTQQIEEALARHFDPDEVKWKPQMVRGDKALAIAYVDARVIQDRLDDAVGIGGWKTDYLHVANGSVECRLSLWINGQWVTKADVGSTSEQPDEGDRVKAAYSDALKRAAVAFGAGRYLYRLPQQWCPYDAKARKFTNTPKLPQWAIPADCKPCGPNIAGKVAALIKVVCERSNKDLKQATDKLLEEYRIPVGKGLETLRHRDAAEVLQRLGKAVEDLARKEPVKPTQTPAIAGKAG
ncbi:MAG: single-stranded DNA-binding protein [Planctomycetaceae bacterium]|nr:single-stranded DNA-binding protein [Planctomycetaceae bacterium]